MARSFACGVLVLAVVLALGACESPPPQGARVAVDAALTALSGETAVSYHLAEGADLTVTGNGLAHGTLFLRHQRVGVVRAGGDLYLRAPAGYWQAQGMSADRAAEYGTRWARSAFDPTRPLSPANLARALRMAVPATAHVTSAGPGVYDAAGLRVTAVRPYRVVGFAPALLGAAQMLGDASVDVRGLAPGEFAGLRDAYDEAVDDLGQPFVAGPAVAVSVTDNRLSCAPSGSCTDTVQVSNTLVGDAPDASARLVLRSSVTSSRLGGQDCAQEVVTPFGGATTMSCSVSFALPRLAGVATVSAAPTVTAEPVAHIDPVAFKQDVATELGR